MNISEMSAIDLDNSIKNSSGHLHDALVEVDRLRDVLIDIVDACNTDRVTWGANIKEEEYRDFIEKISDIAHKYYTA
jgi:hypothetical protein